MITGAPLEVRLLSLRVPKLKGLGGSRQIGTRTIDRNNNDDEEDNDDDDDVGGRVVQSYVRESARNDPVVGLW